MASELEEIKRRLQGMPAFYCKDVEAGAPVQSVVGPGWVKFVMCARCSMEFLRRQKGRK